MHRTFVILAFLVDGAASAEQGEGEATIEKTIANIDSVAKMADDLARVVGAGMPSRDALHAAAKKTSTFEVGSLAQTTSKSAATLMRRALAAQTQEAAMPCDPCKECSAGTEKGICGYRGGSVTCTPYCLLDPDEPPAQAAEGAACQLVDPLNPRKDWLMMRTIFCATPRTVATPEAMLIQEEATVTSKGGVVTCMESEHACATCTVQGGSTGICGHVGGMLMCVPWCEINLHSFPMSAPLNARQEQCASLQQYTCWKDLAKCFKKETSSHCLHMRAHQSFGGFGNFGFGGPPGPPGPAGPPGPPGHPFALDAQGRRVSPFPNAMPPAMPYPPMPPAMPYQSPYPMAATVTPAPPPHGGPRYIMVPKPAYVPKPAVTVVRPTEPPVVVIKEPMSDPGWPKPYPPQGTKDAEDIQDEARGIKSHTTDEQEYSPREDDEKEESYDSYYSKDYYSNDKDDSYSDDSGDESDDSADKSDE